ncbi:MAG: DUF1800 domain-containing protein [Paracoccaceae bacterium]|nr:DUF1800 domain-containing protein [Paracoccaceae bacterium]
MINKSTYSAIRFGLGFSPNETPPSGADALLAQLTNVDLAANSFPITNFRDRAKLSVTYEKTGRARKTDKTKEPHFLAAKDKLNLTKRADLLNSMAQPIYGPHAFRERLVMFWTDHFTTRAKRAVNEGFVSSFVAEAIRPHVAGNFTNMLLASTLHPVMLVYLDQNASVGPNSEFGISKSRGLNENLAREVLELHTLGVAGAYSQNDVRQLAELLTGLIGNVQRELKFVRSRAEPGSETILGTEYGGGLPSIDDIKLVLRDLAQHPDTAKHITKKLAVHFISDEPGDDILEKMSSAYTKSNGDFMAVYAAMLSHDDAWNNFGAKIKRPDEYLFSAIRALGVRQGTLLGMNKTNVSRLLLGPLALMDQPFQQPSGPDGWPEDAQAWTSPQSLAGRIQWAMAAPRAFRRSNIDPREFVKSALGDIASDNLRFAAKAAESRWEGIGLILASPDFNRR